MNPDFLEQLKNKLQTRLTTLISSDFRVFHANLSHFWKFLNKHPIFIEALHQLDQQYAAIKSEIDMAFTTGQMTREGEKPYYDDETQQAAASFFVIKKCIESSDVMIEVNIGRGYLRESAHNDALRDFFKLFVLPLAIYLDELLSDQRFILSFLTRYKQKCEWFHQKSLCELWKRASEQKRGEWQLRRHLLEYLHDQGFDLIEEPASASGEVDLIATYGNDERLIIETKVFNPERNLGRDYIARGFSQAYSYVEDYNEECGYLVIFKTSETDLRLRVADEQQLMPFVIYNNKTIFLVVIDISPKPTASKRGPMKAIEISEEDLTKAIEP